MDAASTGRDHALGAAPAGPGSAPGCCAPPTAGHIGPPSPPAPPQRPFYVGNPLANRFADDRTGYLFGDGGLPLYATHDAGLHWNPPPGVCGGSTCFITSLAVAGRTVYAYQETRGGGMLLTSPLDRDDFTYVPAVSGPYTGEIAASGSGVYVLTDNQRLWAHTATGWQPRSLPACPDGTLDALTARDVILVCDLTGGTGAVTKKAYVSHDSARSWVSLPNPPQTGQTKAVFANVGSLFGYALVVTTTAGTSVQVTRDAGAHWTTPLNRSQHPVCRRRFRNRPPGLPRGRRPHREQRRLPHHRRRPTLGGRHVPRLSGRERGKASSIKVRAHKRYVDERRPGHGGRRVRRHRSVLSEPCLTRCCLAGDGRLLGGALNWRTGDVDPAFGGWCAKRWIIPMGDCPISCPISCSCGLPGGR